ncbi:MAG: ammonia-forming cytochrome c nitrite reductase subunit c552 [Bacteroidia bacterium]|nr:ammonia-forming cytochrome c nitrite reductase subunit c552 [Bacteroidia bacterium]
MQPITTDFIQNEVLLGQEEIEMEGAYYWAIQKDTCLYIRERKDGQFNDYKVLWALGGKNVYYFLTPLVGGRLQTLPLAFDVNTKKWYNNPQSAVRHFPQMNETGLADSALSWRDRQYTFNTSCYSCHVSQLKNNYDLATNTYKTNWKEAGINCETCHGPAAEHIKAARLAEKHGDSLINVKLVVTKRFTPEQHNASCGSCHAKMTSITSSYHPGDRFFDNYDLITLESTDFYPDGRDLGENYTMTGWYMNTCQQNSKLHCVTCHTSSGRYRFKSGDLAEANKACTNCHQKNGTNYEQHTHHPMNNNSPKCIDCHMPMTRFGNMNRSDHSFRPPMPAASIKFKSPNACNLCHQDKDASWANRQVQQWKGPDYQNETLYKGGLIADARNRNWARLDEMLEAIRTNRFGEVYTTSIIRLLNNCEDQKKWPALLNALTLESPLSRSAAALGLLGDLNEEAKIALFKMAKDEYRLVRLAAAQSLAVFPQQEFSLEQAYLFNQANKEYENSLVSRPDDWSSYYNLGNHYQNMGNTAQALETYENALKVYPEAILPLVNISFLYSVSGNQEKARKYMEKALEVEPLNEAANLNYGLLMSEMGDMAKAESALRKVLQVDDKNSTASYNLSVIVSSRDLNESCKLSKQAMVLSPDDPKFAYTYAYFLNQNKKQSEAITLLEKTIKKFPDYLSSIFLLGNIYLENGNKTKAIELYTKSMEKIRENQQAIYQLQSEIERIRAL